jgi:hypothetical protein
MIEMPCRAAGDAGRRNAQAWPLDPDLAARIWPVGARQDLHQRRLAGAVLAHQSVDFSGIDREVDAAECLDAEEGLGDPAHLEDRVDHLASHGTDGVASHPQVVVGISRACAH